jgi:anthranilate synthase component 1
VVVVILSENGLIIIYIKRYHKTPVLTRTGVFLCTKIMKFRITTTYKKLLADTITPVSIYLKLRDRFSNSLLLESSDHHGGENGFSYICLKPFAGIKLQNGVLICTYPDGKNEKCFLDNKTGLVEKTEAFLGEFEISDGRTGVSGLYGYIAYDAVSYFEEIALKDDHSDQKRIPEMQYNLFQYVIALDHFRDELFIYENSCGTSEGTEHIESLIMNKSFSSYPFSSQGEKESTLSDEEFMELVTKGKEHCRRGDVFQVVFSREFSRRFSGDEFNVYRALRSVNPSPYLFYFDLGDFKLFGSSPEAQLVVKNGRQYLHPIAGTFKRTGNDEADKALAEKLRSDLKETAEHVMLVDLARNDVGRNCSDVNVEQFKEIQFYSHVIHLVSKVSGRIKENRGIVKLVGDSFPAGTLSGAPKHRALQLIDRYEKGRRSFYGGCIGFMGFDGTFNSAIMIRSFLSKNNCLFYQAGAGIVESSDERNELNEVNNKLAALETAIRVAQEI